MNDNSHLLHLIGSTKMATGWFLVLSIAMDALAIGIGGRRRWSRALGDAAYANIFSFLVISVVTAFWAKSMMPGPPISLADVFGNAPISLIFIAFTIYSAAEAAIELGLLYVFFGYHSKISNKKRQIFLYFGSNAITAWLVMLTTMQRSF